jgi:hypothetical protein
MWDKYLEGCRTWTSTGSPEGNILEHSKSPFLQQVKLKSKVRKKLIKYVQLLVPCSIFIIDCKNANVVTQKPALFSYCITVLVKAHKS